MGRLTNEAAKEKYETKAKSVLDSVDSKQAAAFLADPDKIRARTEFLTPATFRKADKAGLEARVNDHVIRRLVEKLESPEEIKAVIESSVALSAKPMQMTILALILSPKLYGLDAGASNPSRKTDFIRDNQAYLAALYSRLSTLIRAATVVDNLTDRKAVKAVLERAINATSDIQGGREVPDLIEKTDRKDLDNALALILKKLTKNPELLLTFDESILKVMDMKGTEGASGIATAMRNLASKSQSHQYNQYINSAAEKVALAAVHKMGYDAQKSFLQTEIPSELVFNTDLVERMAPTMTKGEHSVLMAVWVAMLNGNPSMGTVFRKSYNDRYVLDYVQMIKAKTDVFQDKEKADQKKRKKKD